MAATEVPPVRRRIRLAFLVAIMLLLAVLAFSCGGFAGYWMAKTLGFASTRADATSTANAVAPLIQAVAADTPTPTENQLPKTTPTAPLTLTPTQNTPTFAPRPTALSFDGKWLGTTSQGKKLMFEVVGNRIAAVEVEIDFDFGSCNATGTPSVRFFQNLPPITDNAFAIALSPRLTVTGTFTSRTSAVGKLLEVINEPSCTGSADATWNATRQ